MNDERIVFLRALCTKVKEVATLCDAYLEQEAEKNKKPLPPTGCDHNPGDKKLIPLKEWINYHPWPTTGALRAIVATSYKNGSDYFIRRAGKRILICEKSFFEWTNMTPEQRVKASPEASRWKERFGKK